MEVKSAEKRWWSAQAALRLSHVQFCRYSSFHAVQEEMVVVVLLKMLVLSRSIMFALAWLPYYFSFASALGTDDDADFALPQGATHR